MWWLKTLAVALLVGASAYYFLAGGGSIHSAARRGDTRAVKRWLDWGVNPNGRHWLTLDTPLIEAARHGHLDTVELLTTRGADVNRQGEAWYGPLHCAASGGHLTTVAYLLDHGGNVRLFEGHDTPLNSAARAGQIPVIELLLARGAAIDVQGVDGATPLENAVADGHAAAAEYLLTNGAAVNTRGLYGRTPLHVAAWRDDVALGRLLLEHGADPTLECNGRPVAGESPQFRDLIESSRKGPTR